MPSIEVPLDVEQEKLLKEMIPYYGKDQSEVLKNIFMMFIHDNSNKITEVLFMHQDLLGE